MLEVGRNFLEKLNYMYLKWAAKISCNKRLYCNFGCKQSVKETSAHKIMSEAFVI